MGPCKIINNLYTCNIWWHRIVFSFQKGRITASQEIIRSKQNPNPASIMSYSSVSSIWGLSSGLQGASVAQSFQFCHLQHTQLLFRLQPAPLYTFKILGGHPMVSISSVLRSLLWDSWGSTSLLASQDLWPYYTVPASAALPESLDLASFMPSEPVPCRQHRDWQALLVAGVPGRPCWTRAMSACVFSPRENTFPLPSKAWGVSLHCCSLTPAVNLQPQHDQHTQILSQNVTGKPCLVVFAPPNPLSQTSAVCIPLKSLSFLERESVYLCAVAHRRCHISWSWGCDNYEPPGMGAGIQTRVRYERSLSPSLLSCHPTCLTMLVF